VRLAFRTPHVLFLLPAHKRHLPGFREQLAVFQSPWSPKQIVAEEQPATNQSLIQSKEAANDDDSPSHPLAARPGALPDLKRDSR
jgi:hypothetical protein